MWMEFIQYCVNKYKHLLHLIYYNFYVLFYICFIHLTRPINDIKWKGLMRSFLQLIKSAIWCIKDHHGSHASIQYRTFQTVSVLIQVCNRKSFETFSIEATKRSTFKLSINMHCFYLLYFLIWLIYSNTFK